jgi:hypothetical protein
MRFHRTAMGGGDKTKPQFGLIWNVSDGQAGHIQSPVIAMQSMYALRAN